MGNLFSENKPEQKYQSKTNEQQKQQQKTNVQQQVQQQQQKPARQIDSIIIWGDQNLNNDNYYIMNQLVFSHGFQRKNIIFCQNELKFQENICQFGLKNPILILSGYFATYDNFKNIQYVQNLIQNRQINTRHVIIFTSEQTITKFKLNLQELQKEYPCLKALEYDIVKLIQQVIDSIYNFTHIPYEIQENLSSYLICEKDKNFINLFQNTANKDLKKYNKSLKIEGHQFKFLINLLKKVDSESPLNKFKDSNLIKNVLNKVNQSYEKNINSSKSLQSQEEDIVKNLIHLFSQEGDVYRLVNFTLCTINPIIYECMEPVYQIFSIALAKYKDQNQKTQLKLYRGSIISKDCYQQMSFQFVINQSRNQDTYIYFPSFTSTTLKKEIAQYLIEPQRIQMQIEKSYSMQYSFKKMGQEVYKKIQQFRPHLFAKTKLFNKQKKGEAIHKIDKQIYQTIKKFRPYLLQSDLSSQQGNQDEQQREEQKIDETMELRDDQDVGQSNNQEFSNEELKNFKNHDEEDFRQMPKDMHKFNKVIFYIKANIKIASPYRPKYISQISKYSEEEFLFQPFSKFKLTGITGPDTTDTNLDISNQFYKIHLEYQQ